jgi:hypothetical protein
VLTGNETQVPIGQSEYFADRWDVRPRITIIIQIWMCLISTGPITLIMGQIQPVFVPTLKRKVICYLFVSTFEPDQPNNAKPRLPAKERR